MTEENNVVTNETLSILLYDLYKETYNRFNTPFVSCSTEITEEVHKRYSNVKISVEEMWAYSKRIVHIGYQNTNMLAIIRKFEVRKRAVVNAIFTPLYKLVTQNFSVVYNDELDSFIISNGLVSGLYKDKAELSLDANTISIKDAEKMIENVKSFVKSNYGETSK